MPDHQDDSCLSVFLFTGGSGKAGRHVLRRLASRGYQLLNFDLKPSEHPSIPTLLGDMTDEDRCSTR